jgi:hypothetical protein
MRWRGRQLCRSPSGSTRSHRQTSFAIAVEKNQMTRIAFEMRLDRLLISHCATAHLYSAHCNNHARVPLTLQ